MRVKQSICWGLVWTVLTVCVPTLAHAAAGDKVRAEAWISDARPYVQQTVIYTVRVYHGAVKELNPEPLNVVGASFERLDGPPETTRSLGRGRLYSDFRYALTPMNPGSVKIPPMRVKVLPGSGRLNRYGNSYGSEFVVHSGGVKLEVRPAAVSGQSWLPLHHLELEADLERGVVARVGEPLSLTVTERAWGGTGEQLASVAPLLKSADFKVYSEQAQFTQQVDDSGRYVMGSRSQTFTLVPTRDGQLSLPTLSVQWWDLANDEMKSAHWQGAVIPVVAGSAVVADEVAGADASSDSAFKFGTIVLVLLVAIASFVLGWWLSAGRPGLRSLLKKSQDATDATAADAAATEHAPAAVGGRVASRVRAGRVAIGAKASAAADRLLLKHLRRATRQRMQALEPRWLSLWRLRRRMDDSSDPKQLEALVQRYAALQLGLPERATLPAISEAIAVHYPKLTGTTARQLLDRLDAALYGDSPDDVAMARCNKDICCVLRSMGLRCPPGRKPRARSTLPDLNPHHAP